MTESKKNLDLTANDLVGIYDKIYRESAVRLQHPTKNKTLRPYGLNANRDQWHLEFLNKNVPVGSTVLDASCGRGHLLKSLLSAGYKAEGTECAVSLFEQELKRLPARLLRYDQLKDHFGENHFDVVISNDVLEHLVDSQAAERALRDLCFISKKWVLFSVGCKVADNFTRALKLPIKDLHTVKESDRWWFSLAATYMDVMGTKRGGSLFCFGTKKGLTSL